MSSLRLYPKHNINKIIIKDVQIIADPLYKRNEKREGSVRIKL
jgi:hypothetical protein